MTKQGKKMKIEEKIKKNREVFQDSPFFSHPRKSISREIAEPFLETHKVSKVREESDEMLQEQKRVSVENAVMREAETEKTELVFTEEPFVQKETPVFESLPLREMSDELERLSQRYGRGMEEWLDDQSPI